MKKSRKLYIALALSLALNKKRLCRMCVTGKAFFDLMHRLENPSQSMHNRSEEWITHDNFTTRCRHPLAYR